VGVSEATDPRNGATLLAFGGVAVLGGVNAIAVKVSVTELDPFWSAGLRFVAAGIFLVAIVLVTRRSFPRGRSLRGAIAYGATAFSASFGLIYPALREVPAATAMVFLALVPLETFGLAIVQRQERFQVQGLVGALVAVGGVLVVVADQLGAAVPLGPMVLVLAGTLFIAQSSIMLKAIPRSDPFATNAVAMLTGGAILLTLSGVFAEAWTVPSQSATWLAMSYLVVAGSVVLFGLYLFVLRRWSASAVSYVTLLMPLIAIPLAAAFVAQRISPSFLLGGATALVGVYIGAFARIRPRRSSASSLPECLPIDACADPQSPVESRVRTASA
jgi:drug/metabolite transporter (DMT)-like permease